MNDSAREAWAEKDWRWLAALLGLVLAFLAFAAGGSSSGAKRALARLGFAPTLACVNHWPVAIETRRLLPELRRIVGEELRKTRACARRAHDSGRRR